MEHNRDIMLASKHKDVEDNTMQIYGPSRDGRSTSYGQRERGGESGAVVLGYSLVY